MEDKIYRMNTGALAYIGDAVYEMYVRKHTIGKGNIHGDVLHKRSIKYVNANAQCRVIKAIFVNLDDREQAIVKRARNKKISTKPRNIDVITYKWATAFEALLGYYFLSEQYDKLDSIIEESIRLVERGNIENEK